MLTYHLLGVVLGRLACDNLRRALEVIFSKYLCCVPIWYHEIIDHTISFICHMTFDEVISSEVGLLIHVARSEECPRIFLAGG